MAADRRVSIEIDGKVVVDDSDLKRVRRELDTIGNGRPVPTGGEDAAAGSSAATPREDAQVRQHQAALDRLDSTVDQYASVVQREAQRAAQRAAEPGDAGGTPFGSGRTPAYARSQAERSLLGIQSGMATAHTPRDFERLLQRAQGARVYAEAANDSDLREQLDDLIETLDRNREAVAENTRGTGLARRGVPDEARDGPIDVLGRALSGDGGDRIGGTLARMLGGGRFGGAAASGLLGMLGTGAVMALGIGGAAIGALGFAANAARQSNAPAREEISAFADLGRQYGTSDDLLASFRLNTGRTADRFRLLGFNATEAARVAAAYDRPLGGADGMLDSTEAILRFSRGTGLDESQVAAGARALSLGTGNTPEEALRVLRLAIEEGFKNGVSSSDTMQALVEFSRRSAASGQAISEQGLAAQAVYLNNLNSAGTAALTGPFGANALARIQGSLTGQGDDGQNYLLDMAVLRALESGALTFEDAGFTGREVTGLRNLMAVDPLRAAGLARRNGANSPAVMDLLGGTMDAAWGGNPLLAAWWYEQQDLSPQQIAAMLASPGANTGIFGQFGRGDTLGNDTLGGRAGDYLDPTLTPLDPQRGNELALRNAMLGVARDDRDFARSMATLNISGGFESEFVNITSGIVQIINRGVGGLPDGTTRPDDPAFEERMRQLEGAGLFSGAGARAGGAPRPAFDASALAAYRTSRGLEGQDLDYLPLDQAGAAGDLARLAVPNATSLTNLHGTSSRPGGHVGIDVDAELGDPVYAVRGGQVIVADVNSAYGKHVIIEDENGVRHIYAHLDAISSQVRRGEYFSAGMELGIVGSTGQSTGSHLHYQTQTAAGRNVDPEAYYRYLMDQGDGYALGGYTGPGARSEVAGRVHRGEYVWSREATERHLPALMALQMGGAAPGGGSNVRITHEHAGAIRVEGVTADTAAALAEVYRRADEEAAAVLSRDPRIGSPLQRGGVR